MATAELSDANNGCIMVKTVWNERELIKQIPGARWDADAKAWWLPVSWTACVQLRGVFGSNLVIGPELRDWAITERRAFIDPMMKIREATSADPPAWAGSRLYPFQDAGVNCMRLAEQMLLGDEMGTGKTVQVLETLRRRQYAFCDALPALVICPNSVKTSWARHATDWLPEATPYVITGNAKEREKTLTTALADKTALVIVNFEQTWRLSRLAPFGSIRLKRCPECTPGAKLFTEGSTRTTTCDVHPKPLNEFNFQTVIVDEAHRIKDPNAKQTRASWALGHGATVNFRYALTGTPIANDPTDLWSLLHFLNPEEFPRKTAFVDRYCLQAWNSFGGLSVVGINPEHRDEFHKIFHPRFRRMLKAIVAPQLPPKVRELREVTLSPKQAKAYREIADGLVTRLDDGTLMVAPNDLSAQVRLLQFSSANMEATPDGFRMTDPSPKVDELIEILDELPPDKSVAVTAMHKQLIYLAAKRLDKLKISYGLITGDQKQWERDAYLRDFQAGKLRVILFTVAAGGTGLTMTAADTIVFLQRSWSMIDNVQAEDRVHRIGSEIHQQVTVIDVVASGTVEEHQVAKLWEKSERLREITQDRQRLTAAGLPTTTLDDEETRIMSLNFGSDWS